MTIAEIYDRSKALSPKALKEFVDKLSPDQKASLANYAEDQEYVSARKDFNKFAELVCIDDDTGDLITQAPIHRRWADLWQRHSQLIIWSHISSGKSTQLSILRTVFLLGNNPRRRFVILSATEALAKKILGAIANLIVNSDAVRRIFPDLRQDQKGPWSTTELKVERDGNAKDPSVLAVGVGGSLIGVRTDDLIIDDILTPENTATTEQRKKTLEWIKTVAFTRLSKNPTILIVGTAFHPDDVLHVLSKQPGFASVRFPILDRHGKSTWPSAWPMDRINATRDRLGVGEFIRQCMCKARADDEARFKQEWIDEALRLGDGLEFITKVEEEDREGFGLFTGVDLAISKKKRADRTAFVTFKEDIETALRTILFIKSGKFTGPDIVKSIHEHNENYGSVVAVENNAAQDFIVQFAKEGNNVPVLPHTTGKVKHDPALGVESIAIELENKKWAFPNIGGHCHPEIAALIEELLYYTPHAHTGDRLMALYFARDLARKMMKKRDTTATTPNVSVQIVGTAPEERGEAPESLLEKLFNVPESRAS